MYDPSETYTTILTRIYGSQIASRVEQSLQNLLDRYRCRIPIPAVSSLSERDSILITYGDQISQTGQLPLESLAQFCESRLRGIISGIHILPFYPWSSDDGFSVKDFRAVDPDQGCWTTIERLGRSFRLMFDGVINHASAQGDWFQAFLRDEAPYRDYFLSVEANSDLSKVVRPRALPLLTEYQTISDSRRVWTTFSADQVDLDYHNPDVLLEMFDILLMYAERGAQFIRLDAIAYLWKELGTSCINLPQTHAIVQLLRAVLDDVAPHVRLITETNVLHNENISYFGDGKNEAQLIYNFALPPLVLHTFRLGDATDLSHWVSDLDLPSNQVSFFNFLASHDGIGLNPVKDILSPSEIRKLIEQILAHGGLISFKQNGDGTQSVYEMNINFFDALSSPYNNEPLAMQVDRFMAAQAIMLSLRGVPGIYFHSLFGSRSWLEGVQVDGHNRTINRQKLSRWELEHQLADPLSLRSQVYQRYRSLLAKRANFGAFHPSGQQVVLEAGTGVFALLRHSPDSSQCVLCLHNVTEEIQMINQFHKKYKLEPYQTLWIEIH